MSTRAYDFHGVTVEIASDDEAVGAAVDERLWFFRSGAAGEADIRFEFVTTATPPADALGGRSVYDWEMGEVRYRDADASLVIDVGGVARLHAALPEGRVQVHALEDFPDRVWLLSRPLLTLPFVELLKWRGRYSVHAAALARDGGAVLLAGPSGSGKSTLSVALARSGLDFMADDMVFLTRDGHVHAFPDEADLSAGSVEWFPELEPLLGRPHPGWPKHRVRVDEQLGAGIAARAVPKAIVFPSIGPESRLEPIGAAEALVQLTPNVLLTSGPEAQAHLDVLGELARGTPCFRMTTGRDLGRATELVGSLV